MFSVCMKYLERFNETDAPCLYTRCMCFLSTRKPLESSVGMIQIGTWLTACSSVHGRQEPAMRVRLCVEVSLFVLSSVLRPKTIKECCFFLSYFFLLPHRKHNSHFKMCLRKCIYEKNQFLTRSYVSNSVEWKCIFG